MKILKLVGIALTVIMVILVITNPSMNQFKECYGVDDRVNLYRGIDKPKRSQNWIVYSIYTYDYYYNKNLERCPAKYIGIFNNFYPL